MSPLPSTPTSTDRETAIAKAVDEWRSELIDFSRRNPLLYFKDLKGPTLDLTALDPAVFQKLLSGNAVRLTDRLPADTRSDSARRIKSIYRKARELNEERGIQTAYVAVGICSWDAPEDEPAAPLLLYPAEISMSNQTDFTVELDAEPRVNAVLLEFLSTQFNISTSGITLSEDPSPTAAYEHAREQVAALAGKVPGFRITDRRVMGCFNYAKLPMVNDLASSQALLQEHDIIAAIAGDHEARQAVRSAITAGPEPSATLLPQDEYLVMDADASQSRAINHVAAGHSLVIKGPPGTGKSQTIANLIATLIARGKRTLFVAEKRAAIDAVMKRLEAVGLDDLVIDAHDGAKARNRVLKKLDQTLQRARQIGIPETTAVHTALSTTSDKLTKHQESISAVREPWGVSVFDLRCDIETVGKANTTVVLDKKTLHGLTPERRQKILELLSEYTGNDGFSLNRSRTPWWGIQFGDTDDPFDAIETAQQAAEAVEVLVKRLKGVANRYSIQSAATVADWESIFENLEHMRATQDELSERVWTAPLRDWVLATGSGRLRRKHGVHLTYVQRRKIKKDIRNTLGKDIAKRPDLPPLLLSANRQFGEWRRYAGNGVVQFDEELEETRSAFEVFAGHLDSLSGLFPSDDLRHIELTELTDWIRELAQDREYPSILRTLQAHRKTLTGFGLTPLLDELDRLHANTETATAMFTGCFAATLLAYLESRDASLTQFRGDAIPDTHAKFQQADRDHIRLNAQRVRRQAAERLYRARQDNPEIEAFVKKQLARRRSRASLRRLISDGHEVLFALAPCVAMSPLVVSQQLPARRIFDVVIFDEASQIPVPDAIPAIMRGQQVVVTGDPKQLPPTKFFASLEDDIEDDSADDLSLTKGFDSILDSMDSLLDFRALTWHYRSRDERLIGFSNRHIYDSSLTTFPGLTTGSAVEHIHVPSDHTDGDIQSSTNEVDRVVQLVLDHARNTPQLSLGVIAMNIKHSERILARLDEVRVGHPDLDAFFSDQTDERFFVKNLERVQGDERDVIILSMGYRKGSNGHMRYHFGPINKEGGERRLNVAVTRAKHRMITVSSFTSADLDPNKLTSQGPKLLRAYLEFAESGGANLGTGVLDSPKLNPFEIDVRDRLEAAGIPVVCQYGVSNYRIDFAAQHPERPGEMVLAIEADGASYHSSASARDRDRLRQQVLEGMGWTVHRIWSTNWWKDKDTEIERARRAYDEAVARADTESDSVPEVATKPTMPAPDPAALNRGPCPIDIPRSAITAYTNHELVSLLKWIKSDGRLRTSDELKQDALQHLQFKRMGARIATALDRAIKHLP